MDKLGIALHFPNIESFDFYVLDPNWITTGIYRIITSKKAADNKGKIHIRDLDYILNTEREKLGEKYHPFTTKIFEYKEKDERSFIANVLHQYKLAYINRNEIIIPNLLKGNPTSELLEAFEQTETLDFVYEYETLPSSIITQILVDVQKSNVKEHWRTGFMMDKDNCEALLKTNNNRIEIKIKGTEKIYRRDLMIYIRALVDNIIEDLPIQPKKLIPLSNTNSEGVEYKILINRLRKGKKTYIYHEDKDDEQEFEISELLDGIPTDDEIMAMLKKIQAVTEETLKNTENIKAKLDEYYKFLISLPSNQQIKDSIIPAINEISSKLRKTISDEMFTLISTAFEIHQDDLDDKLKDLYNDLKKTDDISAKLKLSVPLLNFIGVNIETEFDIKNWSKKMYKEYELQIFKLFGYVK